MAMAPRSSGIIFKAKRPRCEGPNVLRMSLPAKNIIVNENVVINTAKVLTKLGHRRSGDDA